jgi:uncharacterized membrane protein YphA (DoxX/SURF4 family)
MKPLGVVALEDVTQQANREIVSPRVLGGGFAALRIFFGAVFLSNGLAKVLGRSNFDWGFISFTLVDRSSARSILIGGAPHTFQPLRWIYQDLVLANWGFFQWFLTAAELATGVSLIFGIASRLGALIGLLLIGPIWIMLIHTNLYLWEYPADLFPLLVLAIVPTGRTFGLDRTLAARFHGRWPF